MRHYVWWFLLATKVHVTPEALQNEQYFGSLSGSQYQWTSGQIYGDLYNRGVIQPIQPTRQKHTPTQPAGLVTWYQQQTQQQTRQQLERTLTDEVVKLHQGFFTPNDYFVCLSPNLGGFWTGTKRQTPTSAALGALPDIGGWNLFKAAGWTPGSFERAIFEDLSSTIEIGPKRDQIARLLCGSLHYTDYGNNIFTARDNLADPTKDSTFPGDKIRQLPLIQRRGGLNAVRQQLINIFLIDKQQRVQDARHRYVNAIRTARTSLDDCRDDYWALTKEQREQLHGAVRAHLSTGSTQGVMIGAQQTYASTMPGTANLNDIIYPASTTTNPAENGANDQPATNLQRLANRLVKAARILQQILNAS